MKTHANLYLLFSILLLLLFSFGCFYVLTGEISIYQAMEQEMKQQDALAVPLQFLHTKIKRHGNLHQIRVQQEPYPCLILQDENMVNYFYVKDGSLMEIAADAAYQPTFEEGTPLFPLDKLTITMNDKTVHFTVEKDENKESLQVFLHQKEGSL